MLTAGLTLAVWPAAAQSASPERGVKIEAAALDPDPRTGLTRVRLPPLRPPSRRALAAARSERDPALAMLSRLTASGAAAGNLGDLYDNRDRGHSGLLTKRYPALTFTVYALELVARSLDYGLNDRLMFDAPTFGNSSTAIKSARIGRSLPRAAMTLTGSMDRISALYAANHLYVYPEHRDHDPLRGDRFPANAPQVVISQGSSGSDRPFVRAIAAILAAFQPETKRRLIAAGLVASTAQMILRRGMAGVESDAEYLSAAANPTALDGTRIDLGRMVTLAQAIESDAIPPAVRLRVVAETVAMPGVGVLGDGLGERLFDTPDAAARVAHGLQRLRRYRLDVSETEDPGGRPLKFHWRVLRGPGTIVQPLDAQGGAAEAIVAWSAPFAVPGDPALTTMRADVAVFADNGRHMSAPAFLSVAFPPDQRRVYEEDGRLREVDYTPAGAPSILTDPLLFPARDWRDVFDYAEDGRLAGWTRFYGKGAPARFTRHGLKVLSLDERDRPATAQAVRYPVARDRRGQARVSEVAQDGAVAVYRYAGPADLLGERAPAP